MSVRRRYSKIWKQALITALITALSFTALVIDQEPVDAANFTIQTGYYTGSGVAGLAITGLGFQPEFLMIKSSTTAGAAVIKTSAMPDNTIQFLSGTADNTSSQITFNSDGFTLGTLTNVNSVTSIYYWVAIRGSDCTSNGTFCVGSYTGNAAASRDISTGFQPSMAMVKRTTAVSANYRTASQAVNNTLFFDTTATNTTGTHISAFTSNAFTVGATNNVSAGVFYFVAFKSSTGVFAEGTYTGDGTDNRNITVTGMTPNWTVVKNSTSATAANRNPVMNITQSYGDNSMYISSATANQVNDIQSLSNGAFQVGTDVKVNETSTSIFWFALGGAAARSASGTFSMKTGIYTGTGSAFSVSGIGFSPNLVLIKSDGALHGVFRTMLMKGDLSGYTGAASTVFAGGITSIDADGFSLGTSLDINTSGATYHWQAFGNAFNPYTNTGATDFAVGMLYGNGIDARDITELPWQPNFVFIKRQGGTASTFRTSSISGDLSTFTNATADSANNIEALNPDGFRVGTSANVNTAANVYHWFAFKEGANFDEGTYTGTGVVANIITPGFQPDLLWVKRSTAVNAVQRNETMVGNSSQYFVNTASIANRITAFLGNGFSVGGNQTESNATSGLYRYVAWRIAPVGSLQVSVVDGSDSDVASPSASFEAKGQEFSCSTSTGTLGISSQKIRVINSTGTASWSLSIAATGGDTSIWNRSNAAYYDFNDPTGSPVGCSDGADADNYAGQLTLSPSAATLTPKSGCSNSFITLGSNSAYNQGVTNSITLASASASANTDCFWDLTGIGMSQRIPGEQSLGNYAINLTMTITAV